MVDFVRLRADKQANLQSLINQSKASSVKADKFLNRALTACSEDLFQSLLQERQLDGHPHGDKRPRSHYFPAVKAAKSRLKVDSLGIVTVGFSAIWANSSK
jgi:hypothetical protein